MGDSRKKIYFCVDSMSALSFGQNVAITYDTTEQQIEDERKDVVVTTSLAQMKYKLINRGYDVYLCYKDKRVLIEDGMELRDGCCVTEPSCIEDYDLFDMFEYGLFDNLLGYDR